MSIATKRGDAGETGLVGDVRISKADLRRRGLRLGRTSSNSALGFRAKYLRPQRRCRLDPRRSSARCFRVGSALSTSPATGAPSTLLASDVDLLTQLVYRIEATDGILSDWSLPGAHPQSAAYETARTTCRRVERNVVRLKESGESVEPEVLAYLNRLSDLIWLFGRLIEVDAGVDGRLREETTPGPGWSRAW